MNALQRYALWFAAYTAVACGGKTGDGVSLTNSNASGGNAGNSSLAGNGGSVASTTSLGGTYDISSTTGGSPMGGASSTGGATAKFDPRLSNWWGMDCDPAVCIPGSCRTIADHCGNAIDCGCADCPEEICGKDGWNLCPAACSAKLSCQSAGDKNCGLLSDGCGGIIDCGTCPEGQCCGCGDTTGSAVPNVCGSGDVFALRLTQVSPLCSTALVGNIGYS